MSITVGQRIAAGFGVVILLILSLGWYQLVNIEKMTETAVSIAEGDFETLRLLRQFGNLRRDGSIAFEHAWSAYLLKKAGLAAKDPAVFQAEWSLLDDRSHAALAAFRAHIQNGIKEARNDTRRQLLSELETVTEEQEQTAGDVGKVTASIFGLMKSGDLNGFLGNQDMLLRLHGQRTEEGKRAEDLTSELATNSKYNVLALQATMRTTALIALGAVFAAASLIAYVILRSITSPLQSFMRFVERVGAGDLTRTLENAGTDEIGRLGGHLNQMVGSLNGIALQIRDTTQTLNAATAEMQASVEQQAAGTSEQNAAIQQITSTLSEITHSGSQISERAKAVASAAEAAATASKSGLQAVNETSRAMNAIRDQAEKVAGNVVALTEKTRSIATIITTVNDISERSSLLALNAAIEAAAAGEHGQSFAVVADELKTLANQAKAATVEVRSILNDIQHGIGTAVMQTEEAVKRVESGKQQASATEQTINNLTRSVEQSVATFEQIVAATNQQQMGIEQVTQAIHGIREASVQMAAGSKDVGRAASGIATLSGQLQRVVERYRL